MTIKIEDLSKEHALITAAVVMIQAYDNHDTLAPAIYEVQEEFPDIPEEYLIILWLGINVKANNNTDRGG